jgi:hypothetical protein
MTRRLCGCRMISGSRNQCGRWLLSFSFVVRRQRRNVGLLRCVDVPRFAGRDFHRDREAGGIGELCRVARSSPFPNRIPSRVMFHAATRTVRVTRQLRTRHFGSIVQQVTRKPRTQNFGSVVHGICYPTQDRLPQLSHANIIEGTAYADREIHHARTLRGARRKTLGAGRHRFSAPLRLPT